MSAYSISYGKNQVSVDVPKRNLIGYFEPNKTVGFKDVHSIIKEALNNPIGLPPITYLAKRSDKVAIVTDDITRPTPTHILLPFILKELHIAGVADENITIVFANGSHRLHTQEEKAKLLGGRHILEKYHVWDHDPNDYASLKYLGKTSRNTPIHINRYVAEADLRILLGLIKPHCVAGYTGGGKAILPGVSSIETIISNHNYEATDHPRTVLGVIEGNPIRSDIEEAACLVSPSFILNVLLDAHKNIIDAVAGDMIEAHRVGAGKLDELICVAIPEAADIVIAGCSYPTSINLYQSANAVLNCTKLLDPIVREGGIVIAASPCPEGIGGEGNFHRLTKEAENAQSVLKKISQADFFLHDQWAAQLWASALLHCEVFLVSEGLTSQQAKEMKIELFNSVKASFETALERKGNDARVIVLSDAPYIIPKLVR